MESSESCVLRPASRSEEHTSELQSRLHLVCRLLLEKKYRRGVGRVATQDQSFDDLMRVFLHQDAVVERSRLALVGVQAKVDRPRMIRRQERPLEPRRKASPAASAQATRFIFYGHSLRRDLHSFPTRRSSD